ncbi:accessory gene regulator B family protein [Brevibacillus laterosporus]|uniref:accessory gene regulator ArgB-like protein n=1 Tax=Brevibacillus laterosporus TaxID=1465 RepID=UPI002E1FB39A|nr:accessory gene regulator B family protein [Brevibacillus laterosporus]MED1789039.1 accessory gene regulator B family protein [Brevibacillus laterosporus]
MVEKFTLALAHKIKKAAPDETASEEVLAYSLSIQLNGIAIIVSSLIIGLITGKGCDTLIALVSFSLLRLFSGGWHAKTMTMCYWVSTIIFSLIPHLPIGRSFLLYFSIISFLLVAIYAPRSKEENNIPRSALPYLKVISVIVVCIGLSLDNTVIILALFVQALTLIPALERRCQP